MLFRVHYYNSFYKENNSVDVEARTPGDAQREFYRTFDKHCSIRKIKLVKKEKAE